MGSLLVSHRRRHQAGAHLVAAAAGCAPGRGSHRVGRVRHALVVEVVGRVEGGRVAGDAGLSLARSRLRAVLSGQRYRGWRARKVCPAALEGRRWQLVALGGGGRCAMVTTGGGDGEAGA